MNKQSSLNSEFEKIYRNLIMIQCSMEHILNLAETEDKALEISTGLEMISVSTGEAIKSVASMAPEIHACQSVVKDAMERILNKVIERVIEEEKKETGNE